jgi:ppGpp synthetase/RelA/SpoT-type nucleotidyltranferase
MEPEEILEYGDIYMEMASEFSRASEYFENALRELVTDTFPQDSPLGEFQSRQKELLSIAQKAVSKGIDVATVRAEMTDLIGVRLICLHLEQIDELERILRELDERSVITINKVESWIEDPKPDGYRGKHIDATIRFPRQKKEEVEVKEVPCEIQIRTYAQHAWAVRAHDLIYKPDSEPSDRIKELFKIESLRLHGHQKTMDVLWRMALEERLAEEAGDSLNLPSVKKLVGDYGFELTDDSAMAVYEAVQSSTRVQTLGALRQVLADREAQAHLERVTDVLLGRKPTVRERLVLGNEIRSDLGDGRFLAELEVIASPEFRSQTVLTFDFNVIGHVDHAFSSLHERAGGWVTYHSRDHNGRIAGNRTDAGDPDGVELCAPGGEGIFRAAYPEFSLAYPGQAIVADFVLEDRSHFFVLLSTHEGSHVFLEFGAEYKKVAVREEGRRKTLYVTSPILASQGEPTVRCNIDEVLASAGVKTKLGTVQGFYCQAAPRMVLRRVEVHMLPLTDAGMGGV